MRLWDFTFVLFNASINQTNINLLGFPQAQHTTEALSNVWRARLYSKQNGVDSSFLSLSENGTEAVSKQITRRRTRPWWPATFSRGGWERPDVQKNDVHVKSLRAQTGKVEDYSHRHHSAFFAPSHRCAGKMPSAVRKLYLADIPCVPCRNLIIAYVWNIAKPEARLKQRSVAREKALSKSGICGRRW